MTKTNLGRICFVPRGTYSASESYKRLDVVSSPDNGISYVAIADSTGAALTDETKWQVMVDNSAAIRQLKDDVAAITPDDTVVDGKPWTSKKTVDSLCMPLEATGNPVQVYPVEGYPLGVKVSWEPVQAGSGEPSPDNIRPITGRDAVKVTRCGKNLVDFPHNVKVSTLANSFHSYYVNISGITDVLIQWKFTGTAANTDGCILVYYNDGSKEVLVYWGTNIGSKKITKPAKAISIEDWNGTNGDMVLEYLQVELGSTATPYEPYTGSTTDISLPETVYGGTLDVETGVVTVDKGYASYDGTETWFIGGKYLEDGSDYYYMLARIESAKNDSSISRMCSHYPNSVVANNVKENGFDIVWGCPRIRWGAEMPIEDFKAMLSNWAASGTPMQIAYELAEPYTIQLTKQQIAALSGVNTLYTDAGALTVTGREDPRHTIVTLTNRIAALESAAAGV